MAVGDIVREVADMLTAGYAFVYFIAVLIAGAASKGTSHNKKKNATIASLVLAFVGSLIVPYGIYEWEYTSWGYESETFEWYAPGLALIGLMWFITIILGVATLADPNKTKYPPVAPIYGQTPYYPPQPYAPGYQYPQQNAYQPPPAYGPQPAQNIPPPPPYQGQYRSCPNCGFQIVGNSGFCGNCGRALR